MKIEKGQIWIEDATGEKFVIESAGTLRIIAHRVGATQSRLLTYSEIYEQFTQVPQRRAK
jgi:hypothetical protein